MKLFFLWALWVGRGGLHVGTAFKKKKKQIYTKFLEFCHLGL